MKHHQKALLLQWGTLTIRERREVLRLLRPLQNGTIEPDLIVLSKLAAYFDCGVFDLVRYVRIGRAALVTSIATS